MNFTTLRDIYVGEALKNLGYDDPAFKRSEMPAVTNQDVLGRLSILPDLVTRVNNLHAEQVSFVANSDIDKGLKSYCRTAGLRLVRACETIENLRCLLSSGSSKADAGAAFTYHQHLVDCLLLIKVSLAFWSESIGAKEFGRKHVRCKDVRFRYVEHTIRLVFIIADLTFPEDLRDYVDEMKDALGRPHLQGQFFFDGPVTYAWSKERVKMGLTAAQNRQLKRFLPFGLDTVTPLWCLNPSLYGNLQVPNQLCMRKLKGALPSAK